MATKEKTPRLVVLRRGNPTLTPGMANHRAYLLLRSYWRNGEGWYRVTDEATGRTHEAPDVLFE